MSDYKNVIYSDTNSKDSNLNFLMRDIMRVSHSLKLTIVFSSYFTINFQSSLDHGYIIVVVFIQTYRLFYTLQYLLSTLNIILFNTYITWLFDNG